MTAFKFTRAASFLCAATAAALMSTGSAKAAIADVKTITLSASGVNEWSVSELYAYDSFGNDLALSSLGATAAAGANTFLNSVINAAAAIDGAIPSLGTYQASFIGIANYVEPLVITLNLPAVIESIKIVGRQDQGFQNGEWFVELKDASGNSLFAVQTDSTMNTGEQHTLAFAVANVPLPAALPMLGLGLGALGLIGARRRRRAAA